MASRPITQRRVYEVLLVEDNPADVALVREALGSSNRGYRLNTAADGTEALRFLRNEGEYASEHRPDLILLDWNLPGVDGPEVLLAIKGDPRLQDIPVVVFTNSSAPRDVTGAYDLYANCYVSKPETAERFFEVISTVERFWLQTATLPGR